LFVCQREREKREREDREERERERENIIKVIFAVAVLQKG